MDLEKETLCYAANYIFRENTCSHAGQPEFSQEVAACPPWSASGVSPPLAANAPRQLSPTDSKLVSQPGAGGGCARWTNRSDGPVTLTARALGGGTTLRPLPDDGLRELLAIAAEYRRFAPFRFARPHLKDAAARKSTEFPLQLKLPLFTGGSLRFGRVSINCFPACFWLGPCLFTLQKVI